MLMLRLDDPAPDFSAHTDKGRISLSDFRGKWVVLFAYPADFTPICELDIIGFARNKSSFDALGVQFIGWSVDTTDSHKAWIEDVKRKTGVEIDYPLISDTDKTLAEKYGILHKTKDVTYRGVFIIDPEGILKFTAIYGLDVGRNVKEVERIIKVLQRARELGRLEEVDRAKELSKFDLRGEEEQLDPLEEAKRIVTAGEKHGVILRLIGGLAIRVHCHGSHSGHLREYHDIDVYGLGKERMDIKSVFEKLGYSPNEEFNAWNLSHGRWQFINRLQKNKVDVFLDKFRMEHTLDFSRRLQLDDFTIPITDLLLTKLQIGEKLESKDAKDIVAILEDHEVGHSDDKETLNVDYMADLCSQDWGLHKTVTGSLQNVKQFIEDGAFVQCIGMEASELLLKIDTIRDALISKNKGLRWRTRNLLGERVKWYDEVETGENEAQ
jgi:peroxiredoxin (alkyl hydroperoxide reductase subunit C)